MGVLFRSLLSLAICMGLLGFGFSRKPQGGSQTLFSMADDGYNNQLGDKPNSKLPEPPAIKPNLLWSDNYALVNHSFATPERSTFDQRVSIGWCGMTDGEPDICFETVVPEKYQDHHFADSVIDMKNPCQTPDCRITTAKLREILGVTAGRAGIGQWTICDAPKDQPVGKVMPLSIAPAPRACGKKDCYDLKVIIPFGNTGEPSRVWSVPLTIQVENPKTAGAQVTGISVNGPAERWDQPSAKNDIPFFGEGTVSGDGRLLVAHLTTAIKYAFNRKGPCEINGWQEFKHLSQMYTDPDLHDAEGHPLYGTAAFPLRDSENNLIPEGSEAGGAYPWIDRNGNNIFFLAGARTLYYIGPDGNVKPYFSGIRTPVCKNGVCDFENAVPEDVPQCPAGSTVEECRAASEAFIRKTVSVMGRSGILFFGAWSNGKIIALDSRFNITDVAMGHTIPPVSERTIDLYNGQSVHVPSNAVTVISSAENRFNFLENLTPKSTADVVWPVATSVGTDEVIFDPYITQNGFIVSSMIPSIDVTSPSFYLRGYRSGFKMLNDLGQDSFYGQGFLLTPHVQNAATALRENMLVPAYGAVRGGARVEAIAAGGIKGRGLYLDGLDDRIEYEIPAQPNPQKFNEGAWYYFFWLDPRDTSLEQLLLSTPDGSELSLENERQLLIQGPQDSFTVLLPATLAFKTKEWTSLALVSNAQSLDLYVNGFLFQSFETSKRLFALAPQSTLYFGGRPGKKSFRGWVDEFMIFNTEPNAESVCNNSRGTLVIAGTGDETEALARSYPESAHARVSSRLALKGKVPTGQKYICERKEKSFGKCVDSFPRFKKASHPELCIKSALHFPEGPLFRNLPRPDSLHNPFCLGCHMPQHPLPGLDSILALNPNSIVKPRDNRRQPMEPPALLFGNIPAHYFGDQQPAPLALPAGLSVDELLLNDGVHTRQRAVSH